MSREFSNDLVADAVAARRAGYSSYGKMREAETVKQYHDQIANAAKVARANGYMTIRDRMKLRESK